jgi:uncharacterized membrane protein YozB (DUF420 family)
MQPQSPFKALKILHTAILFGLAFFTIVSLVIPREEIAKDFDKSLEPILQAVAAGASLLSLLIGFNIFKKQLVAARNNGGTAETRMAVYRSACILWWALIDAPGILSIIGFTLTGNYAFIGLVLFHIGLLAIFMPRKSNIILLLKLTKEEVQRLER